MRLIFIISLSMIISSPILSHSRAMTVRIDHIVLAVTDLKKASNQLERMGFAIKPGRVHSNGLLNAHIKFSDQTELELMTLTKEPSDPVSTAYSEFLEHGPGGAFIALSGIEIEALKAELDKNHIPGSILLGRLWDYLIFPRGSGLDHLFFIAYHKTVRDKPENYTHPNGVTGINRIWVQGDSRLEKLFSLLGATPLDSASETTRRKNRSYAVSNTMIHLVPPPENKNRFRFTGLGFDRELKGLPDRALEDHGIFIIPFSQQP